MKKYKILGTLIIISGIILNELTIKYVSDYETKFGTIEKSLIIIFFQALLVFAGIYIIVKNKRAVQNIFLLTITSLILITILEVLLSFSFLQNLSSDKPLWIPYKYKEISINFNKLRHQSSLNNKYGFNDVNHPNNKTANEKQIRIAVLGDSFIWGYGAPDSVIWTRKLEKMFINNGVHCVILNWGKSGWSTLDQYNFLKKEGHKYQFDYLIFSFTINDPVMDSSIHKLVIYPNGFIDRNILKPLSFVFPNTVSFFVDLINNFFSTYLDYGYSNWLVDNVYTDDNLKKYSNLLKEIKKYCRERDIDFSFIMTPENHSIILKRYFKQVINLYIQNNLSYYNLFPAVEHVLRKYTVRELWTNPADGHPGNLVTDVYAQCIYRYLMKELGIMPSRTTIVSSVI